MGLLNGPSRELHVEAEARVEILVDVQPQAVAAPHVLQRRAPHRCRCAHWASRRRRKSPLNWNPPTDWGVGRRRAAWPERRRPRWLRGCGALRQPVEHLALLVKLPLQLLDLSALLSKLLAKCLDLFRGAVRGGQAGYRQQKNEYGLQKCFHIVMV